MQSNNDIRNMPAGSAGMAARGPGVIGPRVPGGHPVSGVGWPVTIAPVACADTPTQLALDFETARGIPELAQDFGGATYTPEFDRDRLNAQARRVWDVMESGEWRSLREISDLTGDPEASVSARLRDFRKDRWGGHRVDRRRRTAGTWEYRVERG